jgi:CxxC motif-containing protein (DUF1111 family)
VIILLILTELVICMMVERAPIDEAIRWHGGEAQSSKVAYEGLSDTQRNAVLDFLDSL